MATQLNDSFDRYLLALKNTAPDEQTEMTSRAALEALLNDAAEAFADGKVVVTHEPRRAQDKGAPDFKITARGSILGYVENKAMGENLAKVAKSDQIKKYLTLSPNLLLTDYLHWMWITPHRVQEVRLAEASALEGRTARVQPDRAHELQALLQGFYSQPPQKIGTAKALAEALATRSQLLRDFLGDELVRQEKTKQGGVLMGLYGAFKQQVSHEITLKEFADAFAQTLAYGLFLAKLNAKSGDTITLLNAKQFVPASVGLIQELVGFLDRLDQSSYADIRWVVEEVLSIINNLDLAAIHEDLAFRNRKARRGTDTRSEGEWRLFSRDPFVYFYEDYLAKYDAKMRKSRGVYYTPPPIVNFIVRAINDILKDTFGIAEGLADRNRVTVLDFATGTGTFLIEVLERIFEEIGGAGSAKAPLVVRDHILKNIYGFEYLIAPYTIAHLKLSQYLRDKETEAGRKAGALGPHKNERFQVFLTNTLEPIEPEANYLLPELSHETEAAQAVKEKPILVITGNPPYARHSKNMGSEARSSVTVYREGIPELSKPAQGKALQDDYVKFIRFAERKMENVERGVIGVITNHSYLQNPTLRGMRSHLLGSFDQVFVVDLHGNKEVPKSPDGEDDRNVFDIKAGVAIALFIKQPAVERGVWHLDVWGGQQDKYSWSAVSEMGSLGWAKLEPEAPLFLFSPRTPESSTPYTKWWSVSEIFSRNGDPAPGFVSTQDQFAISYSAEEARAKVALLLASRDEAEARTHFRLCSTDQWSYGAAVHELETLDLQSAEQKVSFRPFDERWTLWNSNVCVHRRQRVNRHMLFPNIALLTARRNRSLELDHFFVSELPTEAKTAESSTQSFLFPLYLYPSPEGERPSAALKDLYSDSDPFAGRDRIENIAPEFRNWLQARYDASPPPEQLFGYIYAVLHAPAYRALHADFLRTGFPRIPFPDAFTGFETLAALGWELAETHLMRRPPPGGGRLGGYVGNGDNLVEKPRWSETEQKVWINKTQGFANVPRQVWAFTIGGYQVMDKYLKSRKGRTLSLDEIENVEKVANVLGFTIRQMERIDEAYRAVFPFEEGDDGANDIHSDPEIMGGEPVFRGTRVPVRAVAEMLDAGADESELLEGYPSLDPDRLNLARGWAAANPPRDRAPDRPNVPRRMVSEKRLPRRRGSKEGKRSGEAGA
jgi:uncharacterized protein (DUF433 family)